MFDWLVEDQKSKIERIVDELESLDIILFHGEGFWFSSLVEFFSRSDYSHIGLVLKSPTYLDPKLTGNYLLESGAEDVVDAEDGKIKFGVQLTELEPLLENYTGRTYYRKIHLNNRRLKGMGLFKAHKSQFEKVLQDVHTTICNKPYDDNVWDFIKAGLGLDVGNNQRTNDFFCSALVAYVYSKLGILPSDTKWDLERPEDFAPGKSIDRLLQLGGKSELGPLRPTNYIFKNYHRVM